MTIPDPMVRTPTDDEMKISCILIVILIVALVVLLVLSAGGFL